MTKKKTTKPKGGKVYQKFEDSINTYYQKIENGAKKFDGESREFIEKLNNLDDKAIGESIKKFLSKLHLDVIMRKMITRVKKIFATINKKVALTFKENNEFLPILVSLLVIIGIVVLLAIIATLLN